MLTDRPIVTSSIGAVTERTGSSIKVHNVRMTGPLRSELTGGCGASTSLIGRQL